MLISMSDFGRDAVRLLYGSLGPLAGRQLGGRIQSVRFQIEDGKIGHSLPRTLLNPIGNSVSNASSQAAKTGGSSLRAK